MSATALGAASGIEANSIFKLESGTSKEPGFFVGIRLCEALGVPPRELAFGEARTPEFSFRVGDATVLMEIKTAKSVDPARRRALIEMIGSALANIEGGTTLEHLPTLPHPPSDETSVAMPLSNESELGLLSRAVDELHAGVAQLFEALGRIEQRLVVLEGKPSKRSQSTKRKPGKS